MRIPLALLAVPLLAIAVAGLMGSPEMANRLIDRLAIQAPLTIRLHSAATYVVGNRSVGEIAIMWFTLLAVKQCIDYFEKG
jgi:hypothetical protein